MTSIAIQQPSATSASAAPVTPLELLLFKVGNKTYGLPMEQVQHIAPIPGGFAHHGAETARHFVFDNQPLTYLSLWDRLGEASQFIEYEALQALLPQRRQDHLDWMSSLETSIRSGEPFTKARDPHQCAFGKWYDNQHFNDRRLALLLGQFETPHVHIHSLADKLLGLADAGSKEEALRLFMEEQHTTLDRLLDLFDRAETLVIELQRRIAIIARHGEDTCALGADSIRDIVTIPAERLNRNTRTLAGAVAGLVILDNQEVVPLLDWQTL